VAERAFPIVYARDFERSVDFYASLGFEEHFRLGAYAGLRRGVYELAVVSSAWPVDRLGAAVPAGGPAFELYVYVDDVDATVAALRASGVRVLREPEDMPWGERQAYVADPDGNPVALAA